MTVNLSQLNAEMSYPEIRRSTHLPWTLRRALTHRDNQRIEAVSQWHGDPSSEEKFFDALKALGYGHPEVFMDLCHQTLCPISGIELTDTNSRHFCTNNEFKYSSECAIIHSGAARVHSPSLISVAIMQEADINDVYHIRNVVTAYNEDGGDEYVPFALVQSFTVACFNCCDLMMRNAVTYHRDYPYCQSCYDDLDTNNTAPRLGLLAYNDRTASGLPSSTPLAANRIGIELEFLVQSAFDTSYYTREVERAAFATMSVLPSEYAIAKRDGSLKDVGFELVTRPDTYEFHRATLIEHMPKFPSGLLGWRQCHDNDGEPISTGIHINVERRGKSILHQAKMLWFMFNPANKPFLQLYAGRSESNYAAFPREAQWKYVWDDCLPVNRGSNKYMAVYMQGRVMEFRLFRSHAQVKGVIRCLEFVQSLVEYTRDCSARQLSCFHLVDYIHQHRRKYPYAVGYLQNSKFNTYTTK
jgi:hypothetical protein